MHAEQEIKMDQAQRQQALDLSHSFIVQAPAGSGKTELLIQRYLALLGQAVENPEEIVAITFTKKAAAEMRERVLMALQNATTPLAQKVLKQDSEKNWRLLSNPNRLNLQTIDALALRLVARKPLLAALEGEPSIADQPQLLYQQSARELLATLESNAPWTVHLEALLKHLYNQWPLAENLFANMLAKREQWLHTLIHLKNQTNIKSLLESTLSRINNAHIERIKHTISENLFNKINKLQVFTKDIVDVFLTQNNEWRKRSPHKALIEELSQNDSIRLLLTELRELPAKEYTPSQWQLIDALLHLLPLAVAQLSFVFKEKGVVDFTEVHFAAERTLQTVDGFPSDLSLQLDYQIKHLLVDEFQDTSFSQGHFLGLLTAGWQNGDGRTLFLVGDPMQSIYRFRQAEVELFLSIQQKQQFGQISILPLYLTNNYRAVPALVEWNNTVLGQAFPKTANLAIGAVSFKMSSPGLPQPADAGLAMTGSVMPAKAGIQGIISTLQSLQKNFPDDSIAILVRARSHLTELFPLLKEASIPYHALEIETLDNTMVVQDCLTLTRALLSPSDRVAWLALLRAPWCGLNLADLLVVSKEDLIWNALNHFQELQGLSEPAKHQLQRIVPILHQAFALRSRKPLRQWIEGTWQQLGGPACVHHLHELNYAEAFFNCLEKAPFDIHELPSTLKTLFAEPEPTGLAKLQIMTIHRAKGLEFDHVIIPSLERRPHRNEPPLLMWTELPNHELLLGTIKRVGEDADSIYSYLQYLEKQKNAQETIRLLYVAATRAKKTLHLMASVPEEENWSPTEGSLLALLWPWFKEESVRSTTALIQNTEKPPRTTITYKRFAPDWQEPEKILSLSSKLM